MAREVRYEADGMTMTGRLARPDGSGPWPAVLLGPEGTGLNAFQARRADALAEQGYAALAMDIHGGRWFSDPQAMMARLEPLLGDPDRMRAMGHAALDVLLAEPGTDPTRLGAVGYGAGGTIALELAGTHCCSRDPDTATGALSVGNVSCVTSFGRAIMKSC